MPRRPPYLRVHDDGGFEAHDIVAEPGHAVPPEIFYVALEFSAQRAVIPEAIDAAVNLGGLKNEALAFAERHDLFHQFIGLWFGHRMVSFLQGKARVKGWGIYDLRYAICDMRFLGEKATMCRKGLEERKKSGHF